MSGRRRLAPLDTVGEPLSSRAIALAGELSAILAAQGFMLKSVTGPLDSKPGRIMIKVVWQDATGRKLVLRHPRWIAATP